MAQNPNAAQEPEVDPEGVDTDAAEMTAHDYEPSSELTAAQNADLKKGKLPREVMLEMIQTLVGVFALVLALVSIFFGVKALSLANENASLIEELHNEPSMTKQLDDDEGNST